jgi:hypothetical protein
MVSEARKPLTASLAFLSLFLVISISLGTYVIVFSIPEKKDVQNANNRPPSSKPKISLKDAAKKVVNAKNFGKRTENPPPPLNKETEEYIEALNNLDSGDTIPLLENEYDSFLKTYETQRDNEHSEIDDTNVDESLSSDVVFELDKPVYLEEYGTNMGLVRVSNLFKSTTKQGIFVYNSKNIQSQDFDNEVFESIYCYSQFIRKRGYSYLENVSFSVDIFRVTIHYSAIWERDFKYIKAHIDELCAQFLTNDSWIGLSSIFRDPSQMFPDLIDSQFTLLLEFEDNGLTKHLLNGTLVPVGDVHSIESTAFKNRVYKVNHGFGKTAYRFVLTSNDFEDILSENEKFEYPALYSVKDENYHALVKGVLSEKYARTISDELYSFLDDGTEDETDDELAIKWDEYCKKSPNLRKWQLFFEGYLIPVDILIVLEEPLQIV